MKKLPNKKNSKLDLYANLVEEIQPSLEKVNDYYIWEKVIINKDKKLIEWTIKSIEENWQYWVSLIDWSLWFSDKIEVISGKIFNEDFKKWVSTIESNVWERINYFNIWILIKENPILDINDFIYISTWWNNVFKDKETLYEELKKINVLLTVKSLQDLNNLKDNLSKVKKDNNQILDYEPAILDKYKSEWWTLKNISDESFKNWYEWNYDRETWKIYICRDISESSIVEEIIKGWDLTPRGIIKEESFPWQKNMIQELWGIVPENDYELLLFLKKEWKYEDYMLFSRHLLWDDVNASTDLSYDTWWWSSASQLFWHTELNKVYWFWSWPWWKSFNGNRPYKIIAELSPNQAMRYWTKKEIENGDDTANLWEREWITLWSINNKNIIKIIDNKSWKVIYEKKKEVLNSEWSPMSWKQREIKVDKSHRLRNDQEKQSIHRNQIRNITDIDKKTEKIDELFLKELGQIDFSANLNDIKFQFQSIFSFYDNLPEWYPFFEWEKRRIYTKDFDWSDDWYRWYKENRILNYRWDSSICQFQVFLNLLKYEHEYKWLKLNYLDNKFSNKNLIETFITEKYRDNQLIKDQILTYINLIKLEKNNDDWDLKLDYSEMSDEAVWKFFEKWELGGKNEKIINEVQYDKDNFYKEIRKRRYLDNYTIKSLIRFSSYLSGKQIENSDLTPEKPNDHIYKLLPAWLWKDQKFTDEVFTILNVIRYDKGYHHHIELDSKYMSPTLQNRIQQNNLFLKRNRPEINEMNLNDHQIKDLIVSQNIYKDFQDLKNVFENIHKFQKIGELWSIIKRFFDSRTSDEMYKSTWQTMSYYPNTLNIESKRIKDYLFYKDMTDIMIKSNNPQLRDMVVKLKNIDSFNAKKLDNISDEDIKKLKESLSYINLLYQTLWKKNKLSVRTDTIENIYNDLKKAFDVNIWQSLSDKIVKTFFYPNKIYTLSDLDKALSWSLELANIRSKDLYDNAEVNSSWDKYVEFQKNDFVRWNNFSYFDGQTKSWFLTQQVYWKWNSDDFTPYDLDGIFLPEIYLKNEDNSKRSFNDIFTHAVSVSTKYGTELIYDKLEDLVALNWLWNLLFVIRKPEEKYIISKNDHWEVIKSKTKPLYKDIIDSEKKEIQFYRYNINNQAWIRTWVSLWEIDYLILTQSEKLASVKQSLVKAGFATNVVDENWKIILSYEELMKEITAKEANKENQK